VHIVNGLKHETAFVALLSLSLAKQSPWRIRGG